jgi:hypothetical protein
MAGQKLNFLDTLPFPGRRQQEGIALQSLVSQPASTRLLPANLLLEHRDAPSATGDHFRSSRSGGAASDDDRVRRFHSFVGSIL